MNHGQRYFLEALGRNGRDGFPQLSWDDVEPVLRGCWEGSEFSGDLPWAEVVGIVQRSWHDGSHTARTFARDLGRNARWTMPDLAWEAVEPGLSVAWHNCSVSRTVGWNAVRRYAEAGWRDQ